MLIDAPRHRCGISQCIRNLAEVVGHGTDDGFQCRNCGRIVTLHGALAGICDHIVPLCEGGTDIKSNRQTLCQPCSDTKTQQEAQRGRGGSKPHR